MPASRYRSKWANGPSYKCPTTKVGDVIGPVTPSARRAPRTNVVFPAPSSPETSTTSPGFRPAASSAPARSVASGPSVTEARTERDAGTQQEHAAERERPRVDARVGQRIGRRRRGRLRAGGGRGGRGRLRGRGSGGGGGLGRGRGRRVGAERIRVLVAPRPLREGARGERE